MRAPSTLPRLPEAVAASSGNTKAVYLWLKPQGVVSYSAQEIADALHITKKSALAARAELASAELLETVTPGDSRSAGRYFVS